MESGQVHMITIPFEFQNQSINVKSHTLLDVTQIKILKLILK